MYDNKQCMAKNADYAMHPVKQKSINFYAESQPLSAPDFIRFEALYNSLPLGMQRGIRIRTWSQWYPDVAFLGVMVGYDIYNEQGEKLEVLAEYLDFDMSTVPWEDIIA